MLRNKTLAFKMEPHTHRQAGWQTDRKAESSQGKHLKLQQLLAYLFSPLGIAFKGLSCGTLKIKVHFFPRRGKKSERTNYSKYTYVLSCEYFPSFLVGKSSEGRKELGDRIKRGCQIQHNISLSVSRSFQNLQSSVTPLLAVSFAIITFQAFVEDSFPLKKNYSILRHIDTKAFSWWIYTFFPADRCFFLCRKSYFPSYFKCSLE